MPITLHNFFEKESDTYLPITLCNFFLKESFHTIEIQFNTKCVHFLPSRIANSMGPLLYIKQSSSLQHMLLLFPAVCLLHKVGITGGGYLIVVSTSVLLNLH